MEARISYFPMVLNSNKPSYIWNDEDVFGYLLQVNHEQCRSVLHVEFSNDIYKTNKEVQLSEDNDENEAYAGLSDRETTDRDAIDREGTDREAPDTEGGGEYCTDEYGTEKDGNDGVLTFYEDVEMHENLTERDEHVFGDTEVRPSVEVTPVVYKTRDDGKDLVLNQEFRSKEEAQVHIQTASHQKCFEYDIIKSDRVRYVIKCRRTKDGCKWFVRVAKLVNSDRWTVRSYIKQHTCSVVTTITLPNKRRGTPQIVAAMLAQDYHGSFETPVPNTLIDLVHRRVASIEGFSAMKKVLIVDATHLKNVYGGVLLVAAAQDPDHHTYPIAFGVAYGEKNDSWMWFMEHLKSVIGDEPELVFLSDRNKSLINAVGVVFPQAAHGYCICHLSQNIKGHVRNHRDTCAFKFMECAHAYTVVEFLNLYDAFRRRYPSAAEYLVKNVEERKWARYYFEGDRYNVDTTNSVESFNGVIKKARKFTLIPMFDVIIAKMAEWFNKHRKEAAEIPPTLKLVPIVETKMSKRCVDGGFFEVDELNSFHLEYSLKSSDGKVYTVDMAMLTYSCEQFDKDKYPCVHVVAAATFMTDKAGRKLHLSEYLEEVRALKVLPLDYDVKKGRLQQTRFPSTGESRGRGKRGRGGGIGGAIGTGRARGEGMAAYFECGSASGSGV
uniref:SWIM-type domain-containing protein n=1 Tax=Brassica oleracea TaxID=3712 RepID=A0A3P6FQJ1_BRAOL|nr:unnamed protein product [Brassica oleracea]